MIPSVLARPVRSAAIAARERGDLGERALDGDLAAEHVERMELHDVLRSGDAVDQDGSAVAGQRDADVADRRGTGGLDDDVVAVAAGDGIAQSSRGCRRRRRRSICTGPVDAQSRRPCPA